MDSVCAAQSQHDSCMSELPAEVQARVLELLPPNECALVGRFVSMAVSRRLSQQHHRTARLGLPFSPGADVTGPSWQPHLQHALKQLTFSCKGPMLLAAASSGSKLNLELAWGLLRTSLQLELLSRPQVHASDSFYADKMAVYEWDSGAAAVRAGHAHLLPWLAQRNCPLHPESTLHAAAEHCDLAGLQKAWEVLGGSSGLRPARNVVLLSPVMCGAGRSGIDPVAKVSWVQSLAGIAMSRHDMHILMLAAAVGAAECGNLPLLQQLHAQGLDFRAPGRSICQGSVLIAALWKGHLAVADLLVDGAGYPLPPPHEGEEEMNDEAYWAMLEERETRGDLWDSVAEDGSVEAMRWLLRRGLPVHERAYKAVIRSGRLEAVRFLHEECGLPLVDRAFTFAAGERSLDLCAWLLRAGCPMSADAYKQAAGGGDADMVRWLLHEARCPWPQDVLRVVMAQWYHRAETGGGLEAAVRVLLEAGCPLNAGESWSADEAAARGKLPLLRYLHEELGVVLGPETLAAAARGGCEAVVEWLVGAGCGVGGDGGHRDPYVQAGRNGDMATLACLRRLGVPMVAGVLRGAVGAGVPLPLLRWMVEQGAPWDEEAVRKAMQGASRKSEFGESVAWLRAHYGID